MKFFRSLILFVPVFLFAQTPPPASRQATPVPPPQTNPSQRNADGSITTTIPIPPPAPQVPRDKVILTVGNVTLTAGQFDDIVESMPESQRAFYRGPGRKMFADQLAHMYALAEEGHRRKLDETTVYKSQLQMMQSNALAALLANTVNSDTKVDEAAARAYYDAHKNQYELVKARHILIRFKGSPVPLKPGAEELSEEAALAKANKLEARLKAGEDFAKVASAETDDTPGVANGGDLGEFAHGQMVPTFDETAFKLKPGEISEPVKSQFGYHIIKVESRRAKPFEDVRAEIERTLKPQETQKALEAIQSKSSPVYDPVFFQLEAKPAEVKK
jgi:peptidyl-prolyl cis-trans isomerase C